MIGEENILSVAPTVDLIVMNDACDDSASETTVPLAGELTIADFLALYLPDLGEDAVVLINYQVMDYDYILQGGDTVWVAPKNGMIVSLTFASRTTYLIVPVGCTVRTFLGMYGVPLSAIVTVNGADATPDTVLKGGDTILVENGESKPEEEKPGDHEKPGEQEKPEGIPTVMESMAKLNRGDLLENVTVVMNGTNPEKFDYTFMLDGMSATMTDNYSSDTIYYGDEEADAVRSTFIAPVLAILEHTEYFYADEKGYLSDYPITYDCEILGQDGPATITATNIVVTAEGDTLLSISCNMHQVSYTGEELDVTVTFTFSDYGTTVVEEPIEE